MEGHNKGGKYAMLSTFNFNQHINIFMIRIAWSIISSSNNSDSITNYISLTLALGLKISYIDKYLSSENDHNDIFNSKTM